MKASFVGSVSSLGLLAASAVGLGCGDDSASGGAGGNASTSSTVTSVGATTASAPTASASTSSVSGSSSSTGGGEAGSFVYVESNDPAQGQNAIFGFQRGADGSLVALPGGSFLTGGAGIANPTQALGPDDSDQNLAASADGLLVFAVNAGSDTIAVMSRDADGALTPIAGSPFASGGKGPVSLGLAGTHLFVVNRGRDPGDTPSYTAFDVAASGALTPVANSTVAISPGASPSQALVSPDGTLLFGTDFMGPIAVPAEEGSLRAFAIGSDGLLTAAPGTPMALPPSTATPPKPPFALGLTAHPTESLLYTGFVTYGQLGVYSYASNGALTFENAVPNSGAAICWLRVNADASTLYSINSGSATVSWYDLADPTAPVEVDHLLLKNAESGTPFVDGMGMPQTITSSPFQFEISHDGKNLYVVSQRVTNVATDTAGNFLHTLVVGTDGALTEPAAPIALSVPVTARAQGVLLVGE